MRPTRMIATALLALICAAAAACQKEGPPPPPVATTAAPPAPAVAAPPPEQLIDLDQPLGADLQLVAVVVAPGEDKRWWSVTLHSKVLHKRSPRPQLWVHAYPPESRTYTILAPKSSWASGEVGAIVKDKFIVNQPGAFNLYAGVTGANGSYGPAFPIGWVGWDDPTTPAYEKTFQFLMGADATRASAMNALAHRQFPAATLP